MKTRTSAKAPPRRTRRGKVPVAGEALGAKAAAEPLVTVKMVAAQIPYAQVIIHVALTEDSMEGIFASSLGPLLRYQPKRVLVDARAASLALSISDMNGLVKLIATHFAGKLERLAIVPRPEDMPAEKFLEPSLRNRGLPTFVTHDFDEAVGWITVKLLRPQ